MQNPFKLTFGRLGKTVMMTESSHRLRESDDRVVIGLNPVTESK